ncbi:MBL fold metallo-hydrolase [Methanosarcina sp. DH2]|uniref:lamin tail domain-containing protein n=1 Tax=Methanosarcina sp. DH2 TaxID=2605639 RepID=UPI001E64AEEB|nr:lamin tail domain-containing protein [Methanosarcina sp. DH2]MCC4772024.1 MBL fold metallo-hydrolase [Methanosarcina sp. DH2]
MTKSGKTFGSGLSRWIFGLIFVLIIIAVINLGIKDVPLAEEPQQTTPQVGETDLIEAQVRAEGTASGQDSGLAESDSKDTGLADDNLADDNLADDNPAHDNLADNSPAAGENPADENLTVHFLDVGQGDSILLKYNGKAMLIDAGERNQGSGVSAYLHENDISSIDYVVATHPHSDHIGGMGEVLNSFQVGLFIDSGFPHTSKTYENMLITIDEKDIPFDVAEKGEEIEFDPAVDVEVLNPGPEYSDEPNENSVVLKVIYGEVSFLLMGDAGLETEEKLIDSGHDLDSDILKVGHHASGSGSGETFISAVSPEISVIEVGSGNDYGHPHTEVIERLQKASMVYRTDLDGSIVVTTDGSTYTVTAQKTESGGGVTRTEPAESGADSSLMMTETAPEGTKSKEAGLEDSEPEEDEASGIFSSAESVVYVSDLSLQDEWVEITNKGSSPVSLKGWKIEDEGSKHTYTFTSYTLDSQATVILYTGKGMDTATEIYWGSGNPIWNNDGDTASLYDSSGKLVAVLER